MLLKQGRLVTVHFTGTNTAGAHALPAALECAYSAMKQLFSSTASAQSRSSHVSRLPSCPHKSRKAHSSQGSSPVPTGRTGYVLLSISIAVSLIFIACTVYGCCHSKVLGFAFRIGFPLPAQSRRQRLSRRAFSRRVVPHRGVCRSVSAPRAFLPQG